MTHLFTEYSKASWAIREDVLNGITNVMLRFEAGEKLPDAAVNTIVAARPPQDTDVSVVDGVAVVPIVGILAKRMSSIDRMSHFGMTGTEIQQAVLEAVHDPGVKAIVLNIDSPGGTVAGTEETARVIAEANKTKPVVAFVNDLAASAAYWLASQASKIVGNRTADVGSIGVYGVFVDMSKALDRSGITVKVVKSGPYKGVGERGTELTDDQAKEVQRVIDEKFAVFVDDVVRGRAIDRDAVMEVADGRVFLGADAVAKGLMDQVGTLQTAIDLARNLSSSRRNSARAEGSGASVLPNGVKSMETNVSKDAPDTGGSSTEAPALDKAAIQADAVKAERKRVESIRAMAEKCSLPDDWVSKHVDGGTSLEDAQAAALDAMAEARKPQSVEVGDDLARKDCAEGMADALLVRAGLLTPDKAHERSKEFRGLRLMEMVREHVRVYAATDRRNRLLSQLPKDVAMTAFNPLSYGPSFAAGVFEHSSSDFPNILADVMNKSLRAGYEETPRTWRRWMRQVSVADFKQVQRTQLGEFPNLEAVKEGAEYSYATLGDAKEVYTLAKYGKLIGITWETLINDDMDALTRIPTLQGAAAGRLENVVAYAPILSAANGETMNDSVALFNADHSNLAGSGAAPSVTTLGAARAAMLTQTGLTTGVKIGVQPRFFIVPAALQTVAEQLIASVVDPAMTNNTPNPFEGKLEVITEALLDSGYTGSSTTAWYLACPWSGIDTIEVAFLEGETGPYLEQQDGFNIDGRKFKVRHVVASKAIDWRGMYKNPGA